MKIHLILVLFLSLVLFLPSFIVIAFGKNPVFENQITKEVITIPDQQSDLQNFNVSVYRMGMKKIEKVDLEEYVTGVVSSEMPVNFELEALKAQAIGARTYIFKRLLTDSKDSLPFGADITDSTLHQVYKNQKQLKEAWGYNYDTNINKIKQAVSATKGLILTYDGEPIDASFFAASNGYTENSEEYWMSVIPYLRSVPSPWDKDSPKYKDQRTFSLNDFEKKLGVEISGKEDFSLIKHSESNRVSLIEIGGKKFTGKNIREALELNSTDFSFNLENNQIEVITLGYGHGVGMSQYGANGMAKDGKNYKEILKHYYTGVKIENLNSFSEFQELTVKRN